MPMSPVQILDVAIPSGRALLQGSLVMPANALGIVAFAHGSGSSRFSRRNQRVAQFLNQAKLATLLFDLLTAEENTRDLVTAEYRFDIPLLARRLTSAVDWLGNETVSRSLAVGLFGVPDRRCGSVDHRLPDRSRFGPPLGRCRRCAVGPAWTDPRPA